MKKKYIFNIIVKILENLNALCRWNIYLKKKNEEYEAKINIILVYFLETKNLPSVANETNVAYLE